METSLALAEDLYIRQNLWDQNIGSEVQYLEAKNRDGIAREQPRHTQRATQQGHRACAVAGVLDEITPKVGEMASPMPWHAW